MQGQERRSLAAYGQRSEAVLSEQPGRGGFGVLLFPFSKENTQPDGRKLPQLRGSVLQHWSYRQHSSKARLQLLFRHFAEVRFLS